MIFSDKHVAAFIRFLPIHTYFIWTSFPFLVKGTTISIYTMCFFTFGDFLQVLTLFFFSPLFTVIFPHNLSPYQWIFFHISAFLEHAVKIFPREDFS